MLTIQEKSQALQTAKRMRDCSERLDSITLMREYRKAWGERIDHHEFGRYLDELCRKQLMIEDRTARAFDGFRAYKFNTTPEERAR